MKKITKKDIEKMAKEIVSFCKKHEMFDTSIYFNNKVIRLGYEWQGDDLVVTTKEEENVSPHDYFDYAAHEHILSMSFEGVLYELLNYGFGKLEEKFSSIFEKRGLYYELGESWNLTVYPSEIDIEDIEYTQYERKPDPIHVYYWRRDEVDNRLKEIMEFWWNRSEAYGDKGSCVIGAGFEFILDGTPYFMSPCSPYQGSLSWESSIDEVRIMLEDIGATEIYYNYGRLD